jgi:hypothetical protein
LLGLVFALSSGFSAEAAGTSTIESQIENTADTEDNADELIDDSGTVVVDTGTVSGGDNLGPDSAESEVDASQDILGCTCAETLISFLEVEAASEEEIPVYESLDEFLASPANIDRYQYEILKRLEFMQYSQMILIGLIFVLIFKKK